MSGDGLHHFKIHAPLNSNEAFVEIDGKRLEGVTRIEFALAAQQIVEVKLTVFGYVDITGEFRETELLNAERESTRAGMLLLNALQAMLKHSCVADVEAADKDPEDHKAERLARAAIALASGATP